MGAGPADTPENQAAYPQAKTQAPGVGFPILRILVVFSLAVGTVLEAAVGPYQGKLTSERRFSRGRNFPNRHSIPSRGPCDFPGFCRAMRACA